MAKVELLNQALENADLLYTDLVNAANIIIEDYTKNINDVIKNITDHIESMSNEELRLQMMKLSLNAYTFSEIKEKSALKAVCAETLRKEAYAKNFNATDGTVAFKDNTATINSSYELLTEHIYELVANLFKTKLDELHRIVASMNSVLMSRMQEAKLSQSSVDIAFDK